MGANSAQNYIREQVESLKAGYFLKVSSDLLIDAFGSMDAASKWLDSQGFISTKDVRGDGLTAVTRKRPVGRPPAPPSVPISIRVTLEQNAAYKAAGGAKWLKALLDKQIKKQK